MDVKDSSSVQDLRKTSPKSVPSQSPVGRIQLLRRSKSLDIPVDSKSPKKGINRFFSALSFRKSKQKFDDSDGVSIKADNLKLLPFPELHDLGAPALAASVNHSIVNSSPTKERSSGVHDSRKQLLMGNKLFEADVSERQESRNRSQTWDLDMGGDELFPVVTSTKIHTPRQTNHPKHLPFDSNSHDSVGSAGVHLNCAAALHSQSVDTETPHYPSAASSVLASNSNDDDNSKSTSSVSGNACSVQTLIQKFNKNTTAATHGGTAKLKFGLTPATADPLVDETTKGYQLLTEMSMDRTTFVRRSVEAFGLSENALQLGLSSTTATTASVPAAVHSLEADMGTPGAATSTGNHDHDSAGGAAAVPDGVSDVASTASSATSTNGNHTAHAADCISQKTTNNSKRQSPRPGKTALPLFILTAVLLVVAVMLSRVFELHSFLGTLDQHTPQNTGTIVPAPAVESDSDALPPAAAVQDAQQALAYEPEISSKNSGGNHLWLKPGVTSTFFLGNGDLVEDNTLRATHIAVPDVDSLTTGIDPSTAGAAGANGGSSVVSRTQSTLWTVLSVPGKVAYSVFECMLAPVLNVVNRAVHPLDALGCCG